MIGEYQQLIINAFVVKNVVPIKAQLCPIGRVFSFFVVVLYSVMSSVLHVAGRVEDEHGLVTFPSGLWCERPQIIPSLLVSINSRIWGS